MLYDYVQPVGLYSCADLHTSCSHEFVTYTVAYNSADVLTCRYIKKSFLPSVLCPAGRPSKHPSICAQCTLSNLVIVSWGWGHVLSVGIQTSLSEQCLLPSCRGSQDHLCLQLRQKLSLLSPGIQNAWLCLRDSLSPLWE